MAIALVTNSVSLGLFVNTGTKLAPRAVSFVAPIQTVTHTVTQSTFLQAFPYKNTFRLIKIGLSCNQNGQQGKAVLANSPNGQRWPSQGLDLS